MSFSFKKWLLWLVALTALFHVAFLHFTPIFIMDKTMKSFATLTKGENRILNLPVSDENARRVVKPSPDLIYSLCAYDLSKGNVQIKGASGGGYFSLALYQDNSDNYAIFSGEKIDVTLSLKGETGTQKSPSTKGIALFRYSALDANDLKMAQAAQKQAVCKQL